MNLKTAPIACPITMPKFQLFQKVYASGDPGVIVGMVYDHPANLIGGWWYYVRFEAIASSPWLKPGSIDEVHEYMITAPGHEG